MISSKYWRHFALLIPLALAWAIYQPGLSGVFLLDDFQNLKTLERVESPATLQSLASAVLTNPSGDSGRSLAMLSFAVQHGSWPNDPRAFKQVNLLIHLANTVLLFLFALQLATLRKLTPTQSSLTAIFVSAIWIAHPMHVSTVLYVVQRMTMLTCFFMLLGLNGYLLGRKFVLHKPFKGYLIMSGSLLAGGVLALLCKENAILLPFYVLICEATLLRDTPRPPLFRQWKFIALGLPSLVICCYFALKYSSWILPGYDFRNYSPAERLLTESRVVVKYLGLLLLPRAGEFGLFHDDYPLSHGLMTPITTLLSVLLLFILLVSAALQRRRFPAYSFAVLMFLGGHLLESTIIPLELYFEHRNYIPSIGLFIGLGFGAQYVFIQFSSLKKRLLIGFSLIWLTILVVTTWNESRLWGDPFLQAKLWALQHPQSERAQLQLATADVISQNYASAIGIYSTLAEKQPASYVIWASLKCTAQDDITEFPFAKANSALQQADFSKTAFGALEQIVISKENNTCPGLSTDRIIGFINALMENPKFQTRKALWLILKGRLLVAEGDISGGLLLFDTAFNLTNNVELALLSAKVSAQSGDLKRTELYLQRARESNTLNKLVRFSYEQDIRDWEKWLESAQMKQH